MRGDRPHRPPRKETQIELMDRFRRLLENLRLYDGPGRQAFLHVVDGGVSDDLGMRVRCAGVHHAPWRFGARRFLAFATAV